MNERIHELISAYLHRGSTPEQERELFDACSRNPETAELLRQHLVLSLKLHQLRDETTVPPALHNDVLRRINAMEAEGVREEERRSAALPVRTAETNRRFGWAHLLGTGFAGAAVVALLLLATDTKQQDLASQGLPGTPDTVVMVRTDTLTREIERPVYIVREIASKTAQEQLSTADQEQLAVRTPSVDDPGQNSADDPGTPNGTGTKDDSGMRQGIGLADGGNARPVIPPALADNLPAQSATREEKTQNYLEQYTSMLVSVESVRLSTQDRLH